MDQNGLYNLVLSVSGDDVDYVWIILRAFLAVRIGDCFIVGRVVEDQLTICI